MENTDIESRMTPELLAKENILLEVPVYQRLFVWEEEHINLLFDNLLEAIEKDKELPYYIGIISVNEIKEADHKDGNTVWELVDGQQRMTFLTLLGLACQNIDRANWGKFLFSSDGSDMRMDYVARENDNKTLKLLAENFKEGNCSNKHMNIFRTCYLNRISPEKRQAFSEFAFRNVTFLVSRLPESYAADELNLYFEKMNSTGKQLESHEILKCRYFAAYASIWNEIADFSKQFNEEPSSDEAENTCSMSILELLLKGDKESGIKPDDLKETDEMGPRNSIRGIISFPTFLLHVLTIYHKDNTNLEISLDVQKLLDSFGEEFKEEEKARKFIALMKEYREWLDRCIIHNENDRPVSAWGREVGGDPYITDAWHEKIWQFQSMLYVSSGDSQRWIVEVFMENRGKDLELEMLKKWDNHQHQFDKTVFSSWNYFNIDRYWFWKLDYILWEQHRDGKGVGCILTKEEADAVKHYTFRRNRSIEHLHPQTSEFSWVDNDLHGFGNLGMISSSFNSQQGNDSIGTKFGRLNDKINKEELESIKLLLMFKCANGIDRNWTPELSKEHRKKMEVMFSAYYGC